MKRRDFFKTATAIGTVCGILAGTRLPAAETPKARFRLGSQLRGWIPGSSDAEKMARMNKWGMEAVEAFANVIPDPKEFKKKADDAGLEVCVICGGTNRDDLSSPDPAIRQKGIDSAKRSLEAAAVLECGGIIYVPSFNRDWPYKNMTFTEIRKMLVDVDPDTREVKGGLLKELGDFAAGLGVNIILEPLNRKEAWFLRQVGDAASICRDVQSKGVKTMGDFYHMFYEENCNRGAFVSGGEYVKHVHFGSGNKRVLPGQAPEHCREDFVSGFRGLKQIGYQGFMSFECSCLGGDDQGAVEVPKTLDFLRGCWEEA